MIYNDYDNYCERLAHIQQTNELLRYFWALLKDYPVDAKITGALHQTVLDKLFAADKIGYVDWISLSANLRFSMRYANDYDEFTTGLLRPQRHARTCRMRRAKEDDT